MLSKSLRCRTACPPSGRLVSLGLPSCWSLCPPSCWSLCLPGLPSVSFCLPSCLPSCWSLCPPCLPSFFLCLWSCLTSCGSLCPSCLPSLCFCLPSCLPSCSSFCPSCLPSVSFCLPLVSLVVPLLVGHCVRLVFLLSFTFASPLACNPSHLSPSCSALQYYICLSALGCVSLAILYIVICLPCLPALDCCVRLCLAILYIVSQLWAAASASALQSFVSQLWTSQTLVAECSDIEKHKLFWGRRRCHVSLDVPTQPEVNLHFIPDKHAYHMECWLNHRTFSDWDFSYRERRRVEWCK